MKDILINSDITVKQALSALSKSGDKCLVVTNGKMQLIGTLSDGDLRKAILKGTILGDSIAEIYKKNPTFLYEGEKDKKYLKKIFLEKKFNVIPIVDQEKVVVDVLSWSKVFKNGENSPKEKLNATVVIMAGGRGTRLEPFTKVLPKPLIPIHEKPIIEHIIERFTSVGVRNFILTVNYKARIMKAFFEELQSDYSVEFIDEVIPLGTAGSLKLLENRFDLPFFVTNCDIIVKENYADIYNFHIKKKYDITLVASMKNFTLPYGTCEINGNGNLEIIHEKPEYDFLINTGLYVMNPEVLKLIPEDRSYDITDLIKDANDHGKIIGVYPIDDESWIDIGQWAEYQKAVERL